MKIFHNGFIGQIVVLLFAIAMHGFLAAGAFFVGEYFGSIIFYDLPAIVKPFAIGYAIAVFLGAMWTFIYAEYAHEDVRAYANSKGQPWYEVYFYIVLLSVMGSELAGVLFRTWHAVGANNQAVVAAIGILALLLTYALGKVLHAIVNSPLHVPMMRAIGEIGRSLVDDAIKNKKRMTPEEKKRFVKGDIGALSDAQQRVNAERINDEQMKIKDKDTSKQEKQQRKERDRQQAEQARRYTDQLIGGDEQPASDYPFMQAQAKDIDQANRLGLSNGNQK